MALELSTAGILVKYAVEATAGTRPTTGYTTIPGVKSIPEFNPEPSTLDVTDLSDEEWKRYIGGLKDPGSAQSLTVNMTSAFKTAWEAVVSAYEGGKADGKSLWIEYMVPNFASFYYAGIPSELGFGGADVDSVFEGSVYITPNVIAGWSTSSTNA